MVLEQCVRATIVHVLISYSAKYVCIVLSYSVVYPFMFCLFSLCGCHSFENFKELVELAMVVTPVLVDSEDVVFGASEPVTIRRGHTFSVSPSFMKSDVQGHGGVFAARPNLSVPGSV